MREKERPIREHVSGLAAGALAVLAAFLAIGVPLAVAELGRGQLSGDHLTVLLLFVVSALGSVRAGQRWADAVRARRANAS